MAEARDDRVSTVARALAYSVFLAIPAALLVLLGVVTLVLDPEDVTRLVDRLEGVIPPQAAQLLEESLQRSAGSQTGGIAMTVVGVLLALWTTTSAATELMQGVSTAFDADDDRSFVRKRLVAAVIVACLVASAALVLALLVLGPHVERWLAGASGAPTVVSWVWWTAQWPVLILAMLFAFAVLLYFGPAVEQPRWQLVTPGAVVATVIWLVASGAFAVYSAGFGSYEKTWGTLSAVVVTLVWLWLTNAALLFGAEVNAEAGRLSRPADGETPDGTGARG